MKKYISVAEAFRFGIDAVINHFGLFINIFFVYTVSVVISVGLAVFSGLLIHDGAWWKEAYTQLSTQSFEVQIDSTLVSAGIIGLSLAVWLYSLRLGYLKIIFDLFDRRNTSVWRLSAGWRYVVPVLCAYALYGLLCLFGFAFFIIPLFFLQTRLWFFDLFIIDQRVGVIDSFRRSLALTKEIGWEIFALQMLLGFILGLPAVLFQPLSVVIPLVLYPFVALVRVFVYRALLSQEQSVQISG